MEIIHTLKLTWELLKEMFTTDLVERTIVKKLNELEEGLNRFNGKRR